MIYRIKEMLDKWKFTVSFKKWASSTPLSKTKQNKQTKKSFEAFLLYKKAFINTGYEFQQVLSSSKLKGFCVLPRTDLLINQYCLRLA